ncbi:hypothetical protein ACFY36_31895 [Actinoplanes sp. NPDC000266]
MSGFRGAVRQLCRRDDDRVLADLVVTDADFPWLYAAVVALRSPERADVPEFLLHLDGDEGWWRWSDEPFSGGDPAGPDHTAERPPGG